MFREIFTGETNSYLACLVEIFRRETNSYIAYLEKDLQVKQNSYLACVDERFTCETKQQDFPVKQTAI